MRAHAWLGFAVFVACATLAACGSTVEPQGSGGSGATGASGTGASGTGGAPLTGDCQTEADCGGAPCVEVTPGGWKVCTSSPPEATMCTGGPVDDECCVTADCATGACYPFASLPYCGGVQPADYNVCATDACSADADCGASPPALCAPPGAFGNPVRGCVAAFCKTNADCTKAPGGYCAPISNPCCQTPLGLACVYAGGCRSDSDCASDGSMHCEVDSAAGEAVCVEGGIGCPA